jgi:putative peptidoglycan lipid II flippase
VAGAVGALLALVVSVVVLAGVVATPALSAVVAPGFTGEKRDLTIAIVRVLFPGAGLLVVSAWCLGVLNSHNRFLLSYLAPVTWNVAMIATLIVFGAAPLPDLAMKLAWGSVAGSALQCGVQLPVVLRVANGLRLSFDTRSEHVRGIIANFVPVFISRGVVQVSAYVDQILASFLPTGAVTGLQNASLLYTLPVSLFGMSVAAAELPTMSGGGSTPAFARSRSLSSPPRWRFSRSVTSSRLRFCRRDDSRTTMRSVCGRFSPDRRWGCWPRRWVDCTLRPTTRCGIHERRSGTRSSASR